jgi:hypothetical protein
VSRKRNADGLDGGNDAAEHLRGKAYEAFASDTEITDHQLTEEVILGYEFKWAMENLHRSS